MAPAPWKCFAISVIVALGAVMVITIFQSISYYQLANVLPVWLEQHVALDRGSFVIPAPWYQSIDPLFSILGVPLLFWIWRRQAAREREPGDFVVGAGCRLWFPRRGGSPG
jgi:POT family proton-dependent oligopeptide transporter